MRETGRTDSKLEADAVIGGWNMNKHERRNKVEISDTTMKVLEAYNALKTAYIKTEGDPDPSITKAIDAMFGVLSNLLSNDLLIG
jgi:hypothetical protein